MPDYARMQRFQDLLVAGYLPSVGSWVQIAPDAGLTTWLNAYNTLGAQTLELCLVDQGGFTVGEVVETTLETQRVLHLDLETLLPAGDGFEGSVWVWARGATPEGSIGLQAIDLQFVDRGRPEGHIMGGVHLIVDFQNTLDIPPWLDLVCPRILMDETPEGAPRYRNYLGVASVPLGTPDPLSLEVTLGNQAGETRVAEQTLDLPALGSWFGDLETLFPDMTSFLRVGDGPRGYGTLGVKAVDGQFTGLAGMVKVVDQVSGELLVGHLNDRFFARPAMKEP